MEQQYISMRQATPALGDSGGIRCDLPLGLPTFCGETRQREDFAPDSEIIADGTPCRDLWYIRAGILRLQRYSYEGRRQILTLLFPGEIVGFEGEIREGVSVETVTQSRLCRIDRRKFNTMVDQNDDLRAELFLQKQEQLDRLHWLTWSLAALTPEARLCAFLALATRFMPFQPLPDGTGVLSMDLPRKDIADLLGTTVETISRIIHKLSENGAIEIRDSAHFRLIDMPRLLSMGQIERLFDRMTAGLTRRSSRLAGLAEPRADSVVCFCGR